MAENTIKDLVEISRKMFNADNTEDDYYSVSKGEWQVSRGGYNLAYEVYKNGIAVVDVDDDNAIYPLNDSITKNEFKQIMESLEEGFDMKSYGETFTPYSNADKDKRLFVPSEFADLINKMEDIREKNPETAKAFDFAVEKLKAAGIEVVQNKDEFTSILNSEKNIQKMVEDLSDIEKLANQLSEEKEKTQELNEKVQNLEDVKKKNELSKRQTSIDFIHSIDYLIPYTTENRYHLYNKYLDNGIIVGKTEHENKNVYLIKTHTELLLAIKRQSWSDEPFIKTTLDTPESSGQYKTIFLSNDEIIKNLKDLLQNKIVKEQQIQNKNFQKIEKLDNELKSEKSDDIIESFKAISNVLKTGDEDIVKNPTLDDVEIRFGAKNKGLAHIIIRRMEERTHRSQNSLSIEDAQKEVAMILTYVREAVIKSEAKITPRGNFNAELKGIKAVIDKDENGRYVLTGFDNKQKKEESAETINAGIAKYGYAPEFLEMYAQVGAVYSSYQNISQNQNKSIIQEMTLSDGTVYGFTHEGKIYLNPDILSSNTPIHEYTHLWDKYTENTNPELWEKGKEAFKQTSLWNKVISDPNYADIKDDENLVLSECHARICGNIAEKVLERIAAENGEIAKDAVIDWDKEVWTYIAENYSHDITKFASVAELMTMPMKDFWNEKEINIEQVKNFEFEKAIDSVFMKETIKNHESMDEWSSAVAWATINGTRIGAEYNLSYDGDDDYTNRSAIYLLTEEKNGDIKTDYDTFIHYEIDFDDESWEHKLEEAMKNALIEFSNEIKPEISVEQEYKVTESVTFPCGFTFPKEIYENDTGENKREEYRWKIYEKLKEKFGFHDNDSETEYFRGDTPSGSSFNISFAVPVPSEIKADTAKVNEWVESVEKFVKDECGCTYINWQGGERLENYVPKRKFFEWRFNAIDEYMKKNPDRTYSGYEAANKELKTLTDEVEAFHDSARIDHYEINEDYTGVSTRIYHLMQNEYQDYINGKITENELFHNSGLNTAELTPMENFIFNFNEYPAKDDGITSIDDFISMARQEYETRGTTLFLDSMESLYEKTRKSELSWIFEDEEHLQKVNEVKEEIKNDIAQKEMNSESFGEQDMTDVYRLEVEKLAQQNLTLKKENKVLMEHNKELTKKEALQTNLLEGYKRSEIELARENAVLQDKVNGLEYQNKQMKSNIEYVSAFSVEKLQSVAKNMLEHGDKTLGDRFGRLYLENQKLNQRKPDDVERIVDEAEKNESSRKNDGGYSSY